VKSLEFREYLTE